MDKQRRNEVGYLDLLLGRVYHVTGATNKAVDSIKSYLNKALDLLKDELDDNDWQGYFDLAQALTFLEDDDNARAAWSLIVNDPDPDHTCALSITCAGECDWKWEGTEKLRKDLYVCRTCPRMHFEGDCHKLFQGKTLKKNICSSSHRFLRIPRRKKREVKAVGREKILVGKLERNVDDWLDSIRIKYGIPKIGLSWCSRMIERTKIWSWEIRRESQIVSGKLPTRKKIRAGVKGVGTDT